MNIDNNSTVQTNGKSLEMTISNGIHNDMPRCTHIKQDGSQCRAIAHKSTNGSQLCPVHAGVKPWLTAKIDISKSLADVKKYLARLAKDTRLGKVTPQISNAVTNTCSQLIKVHEIEEIQKYLAETQHRQALDSISDSIPADYIAVLPEETNDTDK